MSPEEIKASQYTSATEMEKLLKQLYKNKLKDGWTLNDIDEMDIHFYFELLKEVTEDERVYIDQIQLF